ncbi:MAG TPA: MCE family protein [Acidimicrobiales bacterium]|nr:MCE family protein [Acidimicrobiales bacterium]
MSAPGSRRRSATGVVAALCLAGAGAFGLAGCSSAGSGTITVSANFSDVSDLVAGAPVQFADISVGNVKSINLAESRAKVVMTVDKSADVPADVTAQLQQTTILGEHYVALVAPDDSGPALSNGAVIGKTEFVPGIEQLVSSGSEVFGAVNAAQLAEIIDNGAEGFGGQSAALRQLLDDFNTVLAGYASRSGEIKSVVDQLAQFGATLAPDAQSGAQAISNLAQTTQVLSQQSAQFEQLLQSLDDLAVQGRSILDTGVSQTEDQLDALAAVAEQLGAHQQDLAAVLEYLPGHNATTSELTVDNYAQVLDDVIVCGLPSGSGGDSGNYADNTCNAGGTSTKSGKSP